MNDPQASTRRQVLLGLGAAGAASLAGCMGADGGTTPTDAATPAPTPTPTPATATLRVVHASPNAPAVDVLVDGNAALTGVEFGAVSDYLDLPAGTHTVAVTPAGDPDTVVFEGDVDLAAGTAYTAVAAGEVGDMADEPFAPVLLTDDNSSPGGDTARLRLVHASPDAPAVDVTAAGSDDALFDGLAFGDADTIEVPAGSYTVQVRGDTESNDGDVVAEYQLALAGGTVYTGFAVGYLSPDDEPADTPFDLLVATTDGAAGSAPTPTPAPQANLRVAHASPNAPNVDVSVDGEPVLTDVGFGAVSGYLSLPAGAHDVSIAAAGDPDAVVFADTLTLDGDTHYTVVAAGEVGDMADEAFAPLVLTDDTEPPGDDVARLRLVHASPDAPAVDVTVAGSGDVLFDGVPYAGSGSVEVPAGDYTVDVRGDTPGNDGAVAASFDVSLAGGTRYTALAVGYLTPDDEPADVPFDLLVAQDTP